MTIQESRDLFAEELVQLAEEGCPTADLVAAFAHCSNPASQADAALLDSLWRKAALRVPAADFPYQEPSDLPGIQAARPEGPRELPVSLTDSELEEKIRGAWYGRIAGCILGKPVEGLPRERIQGYLEHVGEWPLTQYFAEADPETVPEALRIHLGMKDCLRPNITYAAKDDDTDYSVFGLVHFKQHGLAMSTSSVGNGWLTYFPYNSVCTAEHVAYRNLIDTVTPPATALIKNPFREWIGAQIRADFWGWVAPGKLQLAADLAFRDAALSHVKNGIYGEMFIAALLSAAYVTGSVQEAIQLALTEIPANCRLAEAVRDTVAWAAESDDWGVTWDKMMAKYGRYHWVHTINNCCIVLIALLHGGGDFGKTISIAVMGGLDTDCNGATAGSIMGVLLGASGIPAQWTEPLHDELRSSVQGYNRNKISELAAETLSLLVR